MGRDQDGLPQGTTQAAEPRLVNGVLVGWAKVRIDASIDEHGFTFCTPYSLHPNDVARGLSTQEWDARGQFFGQVLVSRSALPPAEDGVGVASADPLSATSPIPEGEGLPQPMAGAAEPDELLEHVALMAEAEGDRQADMPEWQREEAFYPLHDLAARIRKLKSAPEEASVRIAAASSTPTTAREGGDRGE